MMYENGSWFFRDVDDDQSVGATGGQSNQQGSGPFANWAGFNVPARPTQMPSAPMALPPPSATYTGRFLSQSARCYSQLLVC